MTELPDMCAVELVAAYRSKMLSPVAVIDAVLDRVAAWDDRLCAFWLVHADEARCAARESEARWMAGAPLGPIDGVPVSLKENLATKGHPVPMGTVATELVPAAKDAPCPARIAEAGGIVIGKTTMPDYAMASSGLSSFHRLSRNPWNLERTPGGSSAGAGTAGAAGMGALHVGTDIGGSIRLPAGWCGLVGLKPSFGRVPIAPNFYGRAAGPMTRTVADTALLMSVLSLPDARDPMCLPFEKIDWMALDIDVRGVRIGLQLDAGVGLAVDPEIAVAVQAAGRLFEENGAIVEPVAPFMTRAMLDGLDDFWRMRFYSDTASMSAERKAGILPYIREWVDGAAGLSGERVYRGFAQMSAIRDAALAAQRGFDFILAPTAPCPPAPADWSGPTNDPARPFEHIGFTLPHNMSDQPSISVNCGYTSESLPIGLQIAGHRFDDIGVLRMAHFFERIRPAQRPWPRFD